MSDPAASAQPRLGRRTLTRSMLTLAIVVGIIGLGLGPAGLRFVGQRFAQGHLHAPNLGLIARAPLVVQLHLLTVLAGFAIGTVQMLGPKGTPTHRAMGWIFALFMMFTALDALFIKNGPNWGVSPIQLFSLMVLIGLPFAIRAARSHDVDAHRRAMTGLYFGGLVLAGFFTLIPGRLMWNVFFG